MGGLDLKSMTKKSIIRLNASEFDSNWKPYEGYLKIPNMYFAEPPVDAKAIWRG